jgi:quercetin dioxygenase-like cupin family protein
MGRRRLDRTSSTTVAIRTEGDERMPILRLDDAPMFELNGIAVRGLASPSRGASETMSYRVDLGSGQRLPEHRHDHEEVFHLLDGSLVVSLGGDETELRPGDTVMIPPGVSHFSYEAAGAAATLLAVMPVGTVMIRHDGERVSPPWGA